jgi:hypothetical protein
VSVVEGLQDVLHQPVVEVDAAEEGVAAGGDDLEDLVLDVDDRDVEGAAAEVVDATRWLSVRPRP